MQLLPRPEISKAYLSKGLKQPQSIAVRANYINMYIATLASWQLAEHVALLLQSLQPKDTRPHS